MEGDAVQYEAGDIIFKEGDAGGFFLYIEDGSVEVFKESDKGDVPLSIVNSGEVLGLLTFYNEGTRHASARARTAVKGRVIRKSSALKDVKLPQWVTLVIKEYSARLSQVNRLYSRAYYQGSQGHQQLVDRLFIARQMASGIEKLAPHYAKELDDGQQVVQINECLQDLAEVLGFPKAELKAIFEVMKNNMLVKVILDPDNQQEVIPASETSKLRWFCQFLAKARQGQTRKQVEAQLPFKFRKILFGLRDYCQQKDAASLSKTATFTIAELDEHFEELTKVAFDAEALRRASELNLLELKETGNELKVVFNPLELTRTLICINIINRLQTQEET